MVNFLKKIWSKLNNSAQHRYEIDLQKLQYGKILCQLQALKMPQTLSDAEFKVFSQWGDDGIIQYLISNIDLPHKTFIEFGVEDFEESNSRFLLLNNNFSGLVLDGSKDNIERIKNSWYFWRHDLQTQHAFITAENINELLQKANFDPEVGILHIDVDGNDFYIFRAIDTLNPVIVVVEYNSLFGAERPISIPYDAAFVRTRAHWSNLFFGASLSALNFLAEQRNYSLIGCNSAGNNAYFVRNDKLNDKIKKRSVSDAFVEAKFRESRDQNGNLTYLNLAERRQLLQGMKVYNVITQTEEIF